MSEYAPTRNRFRDMKLLLAIICAATLSGCATQSPAVQMIGDSYCGIARRITWDVADTPATVDQVRRHNAQYRRVCKP